MEASFVHKLIVDAEAEKDVSKFFNTRLARGNFFLRLCAGTENREL